MKLEQQVVSYELAVKLKEKGMKQESQFYWVQFANGYAKRHHSYQDNLHWELRYRESNLLNFPEKISAFTVPELMEAMPDRIKKDNEEYFFSFTKRVENNKDYYYADYTIFYDDIWLMDSEDPYEQTNPSNALAECAIWLVENGYWKVKK